MAVLPRRNRPRVVAISGGKGGVGKSTVAVNLATALARSGQRTVIVDADLGAANLHTMFGLIKPATSLSSLLDGDSDSLDGARIAINPALSLVPGTSRPGAANLTSATRLRLLRALLRLEADCVIVDIGAGTNFTVVDLVNVADLKLFVVTPQLPSIHNAYALLKACVHRIARKLASNDVEQGLIDAALGNDHKARTIKDLLGVLRGFDPTLSDRIEDVLDRFGAGLICNQITTPAEAAALGRMPTMIHDHLRVDTPVVATIRRSPALAGGLKAGANVVDSAGDTAAAFRSLAQQVMSCDVERLRGRTREPRMTMPLWTRRVGDTLVDQPAPTRSQ